MNRNLALSLVLLLVAAGAFVFWQFGLGAAPPNGPNAPGAQPDASASAQRANGGLGQDAGAVAPAAATVAPGERVAVAAAVPGGDASKPFLTGQVVGTGGQPIAGAKVVAAPALAFANANGDMDPGSFDVADFEDQDMFDPSAVLAAAKQHLGERIETLTDGDGRFRIQPRGTSRGVGLRVLARGHAILDRRVDRPATADADVGVLTLQRGAVVAGRVVDGAGNPVAGASVRRVPEAEARVMEQMLGGIEVQMPGQAEVENLRDGETSETDTAGRFELAHVTAGEITLRARHRDHPAAKLPGLMAEAGAELRDVIITMQRGSEIRGRVSGVPEGVKDLQVVAARKPDTENNPMGGVMGGFFGGDMTELFADAGMPFGEQRVAVEADGSFVLRGLAAATYRLWPTQLGKGFAGNMACGPRVEVAAGSFGVDLRYEPGVSVTLKVLDAATKEPIERLWVRDVLRGGEGFADMMAMAAPNMTRAQHYPGGAVTVANVRAKGKQTLQLTVDAIGYRAFERRDIALPKAGSLDLGTVELESAPVVRITVVAADDGTPVAGATVRLGDKGEGGNAFVRVMGERFGGGGPRSGKTGADGRCTLNTLREEKGVVEVDSVRFAPFVGDEITFRLDGATDYVARLHVGGRVDVTVLGPDDKPVKEAMVEQQAPSGALAQKKTDALGVVSFERLAPGSHGFRLGKDEGPMGAFSFSVSVKGADPEEPGWQTVDVADRARASLTLAKKPTALLRGVVRENGAPLAGARVAFAEGENSAAGEQEAAREMVNDMMGGMAGGKRSAKSGDGGEYELADLPEGTHRLRVTHKSRAMPAVVSVVLRNGENVLDVDLEMTTVRGVVLDSGGKPVDGARVRARRVKTDERGLPDEAEQAMEGVFGGLGLGDGGNTIKTDATGAFELRGVDPDVGLKIHATAKGFAPASASVTVARGATSDVIELRLGPAGRIKVTGGTEAAFAMVVARFVGEGEGVAPVTQMLRKGKGTLDGLRPGTWELECHGMAGEDESTQKRRVDVVAGQTVEVAF